MIGGISATGGDLVFAGEGNGLFKAYDAKTGKVLWSFQCGAGVNAPPVTYMVDGKRTSRSPPAEHPDRLQARQQRVRVHAP